jgi:hypothetical protein
MNFINVPFDLKNRQLNNPIFTNFNQKGTRLTDPVVCYNDGRQWKIVPLKIALMYPIIQDNYYTNLKEKQDITSSTVFICPYTLFTAMYLGDYQLHNQIYVTSLTITKRDDPDKIIIPIINKTFSYSQNIYPDNDFIREQTKIMTLRNAITQFPDCLFLNTKKIDMIHPIVDYDYLFDKTVHFDLKSIKKKLLVYVIEYKSKKIVDGYKYAVIVPKKNTFDLDQNGFGDYYEKMIEKIKYKNGFVFPCFLFAWESMGIKSKMVRL